MPISKRASFAVDDFNRLLIKKAGRVYPVEGEFKIEKNNLFFDPDRKSPLSKELGLAQRLKFQGNWQLNDNRDLRLSLIENADQRKGDALDIKGRIIGSDSDALIFE